MRYATGGIWLVVLAAVVASVTPTAAKEFYVGEPIVKNEMQLVPHYLLGIEMAPMTPGMDMGPNAVHLEIDVHAMKDDKHGFKEDEWIPISHNLIHDRESGIEVQENRKIIGDDRRRRAALCEQRWTIGRWRLSADFAL